MSDVFFYTKIKARSDSEEYRIAYSKDLISIMNEDGDAMISMEPDLAFLFMDALKIIKQQDGKYVSSHFDLSTHPHECVCAGCSR